jgi:hypothetical protein
MKRKAHKPNLKHYRLILAIFCLSINLPLYSQNSFVNICDFGADNTGVKNSSVIINRLIDSLSNHQGGTLFFPAGKYSCGPIFLKSNITLLTDAGAIIHFSDNFDEYLPMITSQWEGIRVKTFASQVYAINAENISIKGEGHFEGHGQKWWDYLAKIRSGEVSDSKWQKIFAEENKEILLKNEYLQQMKGFLRPPMVLFYNCKDVLIEGVSFSNPPFWTLVPVYCDNIVITGVKIFNPGNSPNTDGIDPCSCRNVKISNCHISVGDDCIVIKSGRDEDGRDAGIPTENVTITNCTMLNGHGGVVLGSEMSGDIRRVAISNCVFEGTDRGIRFKTMRGRGGIVEDVNVSNIIMHNIIEEGIVLNMRYQNSTPEPVSERTPTFQDIHFSNISIGGAKQGIALIGLEERDVEQVTFSGIFIRAEKGIWGQYAENLSFDDIQLESASSSPIVLDKCKNISIDELKLIKPQASTNVFQLSDCYDIKISNCFQPDKIESFLKFDDQSRNIYLINNQITNASKITKGSKSQNIIIANSINE